MSIEYSSVIAAPEDEVFAWHTRPGAMPRLVPPWQPMTVIAEADSLADGRAVLGLPGGLRWASQHDPSGFVPGRRFVDNLSTAGVMSWPTLAIGRWRHTHEFNSAGPGKTRMRDHVETPIPGAALRSTVIYRHRQLDDDLAAHRTGAEHGARPQVIAISGASGLVGTALSQFLTSGGHRVIRLVRRLARDRNERYWDPAHPTPNLLSGIDAVIHLAGTSIAGRFTASHMRDIRDSRIEPTRQLAKAAVESAGGPSVFISASAIGFYGFDRGDDVLTEHCSRGDGFLADVVTDWEEATAPAEGAGLRVVTVRTGIVQSANGGILRLLRPLFGAGLGGRLGNGTQWLSWISIDDLVDVYHRALWDDRMTGPVNAVAPHAVRNLEYTRVLASVMHRPAVLPVPTIGPRLLLGADGVRELAEANQRVTPARLLDLGHRFRQPSITDALSHQLGR
jgi:uncharacterized protein (TIGR01777 family)